MNERLSANPNRAGAINNDRMLRRVWHEYLSVLLLYSSLFERKSLLTKLHVPDYNEASRNAPWNTWIRSVYDAFFPHITCIYTGTTCRVYGIYELGAGSKATWLFKKTVENTEKVHVRDYW